MKKVYHHNEHTDRIIRNAYSSPDYRQKRGASVKKAAERLGWPRHVVYNRAIVLGVVVPQKKPEPWTAEEMELLDRHCHKNFRTISRIFRTNGFHRTPTAVGVKLKRTYGGYKQLRVDSGYVTGAQAADLIGVNDKTLRSYIQKGWLKATRQGTDRIAAQGGDIYRISERDLRKFIINYTAHLNFARIDKYWLVELLVGDTGEKVAA